MAISTPAPAAQPATTTAATTAALTAATNALAAAQPGATATTPAPVAEKSLLQQAFDKVYDIKLKTLGNPSPSIVDGLNDMSSVLGVGGQRIANISAAIAVDASKNKSYNPIALQQLQMETTRYEQSSTLQKSILDKLAGAISPWMQGTR